MRLLKPVFIPLRLKLLAAAMVVEVVMLGILVWNAVRLNQESLVTQTQYRIEEVLPLLNASLAAAVVNEDMALIQELLDQLVRDSGFAYIAVYEVDENLIRDHGERINEVRLLSLAELADGIRQDNTLDRIALDVPLLIAQRRVGRLYLQLNTHFIGNAIASVAKQGTAIAVFEVLLTAILLSVLGFTLTRHLNVLTKAVRGLPATRPELSLTQNSNDEIGVLSDALRGMVDELSLHERHRDNIEQALREREQQINLLLNSTAEAIVGLDREGCCTFFNRACLNLLGDAPHGNLLGQPILKRCKLAAKDEFSGAECSEGSEPAFSVPKLSENGPADLLRQTLEQGQGLHSDQLYFQRRDNSWFPVECWFYPVMDGVHVSGAVVTFIDISERQKTENELNDYRRHLEKLVDERTKALLSSNRELQSYSYSIAHDLRSPVRAIIGFSQILQAEARDKLSSTQMQELQRVINAGKRMSLLIDDILELSKINRTAIQPKSVDLTTLAHGILDEWGRALNTDRVQCQIEPGMLVEGDARLVDLLIRNLLSNAIKYSSKTEIARIRVGKTTINGEIVYFVADNGVGFDMRFADKVFQPFQRLHREAEFEGTGVGLAIARRVVDRHLGRIWIESKIAEGTTVYFTLVKPAVYPLAV